LSQWERPCSPPEITRTNKLVIPRRWISSAEHFSNTVISASTHSFQTTIIIRLPPSISYPFIFLIPYPRHVPTTVHGRLYVACSTTGSFDGTSYGPVPGVDPASAFGIPPNPQVPPATADFPQFGTQPGPSSVPFTSFPTANPEPAPWSDLANFLKEIMGTQQSTKDAMATIAKQLGRTGSTRSKATPKFKEPTMFTGKATQVVGFIQEVKDTVYLLRDVYVLDKDKCIYMSTYLGPGTPKEWYNSILLLSPDLLDDFSGFCDAFRKHFGDSNLAVTAQNKLDNLYQTGSAAQYAARFMEYIVHLNLSEDTKILYFYRHLKNDIKDSIAHRSKDVIPTTLKPYIDLVVEIDDSLHQRDVERRKDAQDPRLSRSNRGNNSSQRSAYVPFTPSYTSYSSPSPSPSPSSSSLPPGEPMQIDLTISKPRGPLTHAERNLRRTQNLCLYCGGSGHKIAQCPNMSEEAKKNYLAKQKARSEKQNSASGKA
jgi:hypothetical protein